MKKMKKTLSLLLCVVMLAGMFPVSAFAAEDVPAQTGQQPASPADTQQQSTECQHTGGVATCTALAVCEACEQPYGELAEHSFAEGKCANCGAADPDYVAPCEHSYGEDGKCALCGDVKAAEPPEKRAVKAVPAVSASPELGENLVYNCQPQTLATAAEGSLVSLNGETWASSVTATDAGDYTVYYKSEIDGVSPEVGQVTVTINRLLLSFTPQPKKYFDGDIDFETSQTLGGNEGVLGDDEVVFEATYQFPGKDTGTYVIHDGRPVTLHSFTLSGADSGNYSVPFKSGDVFDGLINPLPLTVKVMDSSKPYLSADPEFAFEVTSDYVSNVGAVLAGCPLELSFSREEGEALGSYTVSVHHNMESGLPVNTNYILSFVPGTLDITGRKLTLAGVKAVTKGYDGTADATIDLSEAYLENLPEGYTIEVSSKSLPGVFDSADAGERTVSRRNAFFTIEIYNAEGENERGNFSITVPSSFPGVIEPAILDVSYTGEISKEYDGESAVTLDPAKLSCQNLPEGCSVEFTSASGSFNIADAGRRSLTVSAEGIVRDAGGNDVSHNYAFRFADAEGEIKPRPISANIRVLSKSYDGSSSISWELAGFDKAIEGKEPELEVKGRYLLGGAEQKDAAEDLGYDLISVSLSGENAANYVLTDCSAEAEAGLSIEPRPITVKINDASKTYGDPDPELSYTVSGLLPGDTLEGSLSREEGENVGTYAINLGTLDNPNYAITLVPANFLIEKREITISGITAETREYDGTTNATIDINTLDPVFSNVPAGESFYVTVDSATYEDPDAGENKSATPGYHYIWVTDGYDINNYEFVFAPITGTITPRPITVTANNVSKTYGEDDPNLTYCVTGGQMVDSDTFTGELSRVEGENVGEYDITIGTLANPNYDITLIPGKLTITKAASSISFAGYAPGKTYDGTALAVPAETELNISGALYTDVTYTWYKDSVSEANRLNAAPKDAGSYVLVATIPDSSNTGGSKAESAAITISPAPVTVTPTDMQKVYLDPDRVIEYTAEGLIPVETLSGALSREEGEELGPYDVTIGTLQSENPNYNITLKPGVVIIMPRVIYVRGVSAEDKVYDETTHATLNLQAVELGNLPEAYPDAITALELMGIFYTADAGEDKYVDVSLVDFTVSEGLDKDGFIFSVSDTSADITPLPIEITVYQSSKYYSDAEPGEFSYSVEPYVSLALEISREAGENVGEYDFILETELKNHAASFANSFLIERKPINTINYSAALYHGEYTGEAIDGLMFFEFEDGLVEGTDYTVSGNIRTAIGTHVVTFTGIGNYCDEQTLSFEIWPPSTIRDVLDGTVTPETVMPEDYEELKLLEDALATIDENTEHEDLDQWKHAAEKLAPIIDALEELEALVNSENIKAAEDINADNVTADDKETLEAAKADIEKLLDEHSGKLDAGTVAELEDKLETIEETLDTLEDAESIISEIEKWLKDNKDKFDADELKLREEYKDIMDDIDALNANAQRIVKDAVGAGLKAAEAKLYTYKIISGDGANWVKGSGATLDFTANGAVSLFDHLLVDGKKLDAANYTVSSGSTIVKLKADYLQALVPGKHNIQFVYTDGSTNVVEFIVGYTISGTVQTGDSSNPALWLSLMLSSLAAIMVSLPRLKRRKEEN